MSSLVRNARSDYHLDTRIRRHHVPLLSQQRRLRHLKCLVARNIVPTSVQHVTGIFYSLHQTPKEEAFYTSEVSNDCLNPAWRMFEPSCFPDEISTSECHVTAKIWFVKENQGNICVLEWLVYFSGLVFLGEQIPKESKKFKPNTLLFGTAEGFYGCPDCMHLTANQENTEYSSKESMLAEISNIRISYSVNTVYRIQTVQRAIKQTQAAVRRSRASIQEQLKRTADIQSQLAKRESLKMNLKTLSMQLQVHTERLEKAKARKEELKKQLREIGEEHSFKTDQLGKDRSFLIDKRRSYYESCEMLLKTSASLTLRRKQLISELSCIYPITLFPEKNGFSICGVHLPNSLHFSGHDETMICVALGYISHLILMISHFLNIPLRFPVHHYGSRSTILDLVLKDIADKDREFPLFSRGKDKIHFSYAVYLLNKNIAQLRQYCALNTPDLSATLANLNDLIEQRLSIKIDQYQKASNPIYVIPSVPPSVVSVTLNPQPTPQFRYDPFQSMKVIQNGVSPGSLGATPPENISSETSMDLNSLMLLPQDSASSAAAYNADVMANLERKMADLAAASSGAFPPRPRLGAELLSAEEREGANLSCSLDKGLNKIKMLSLEELQDSEDTNLLIPDKREKILGSLKLGSTQHSSVPNLQVLSAASLKGALTIENGSNEAL